MFVTIDTTHAPFVQCGKWKLSSSGGDCGSKKRKGGYGVACGGVWRSLRSAGCGFCVDAFSRNLPSVAVKMPSHLMYSTNNFYKYLFSIHFEKVMLQ
jgi:hypothetical protein